MPLTGVQRKRIEDIIKKSLGDKFENYSPETKHMPFHYRLLGQDRMALYAFIHSLNTKFGQSIFEPVAETLAEQNFESTQKQFVVGDAISKKAQAEIQSIINDLAAAKADPDKSEEIERIRTVCTEGGMETSKPVRVDLFVRCLDGTVHLFDLKTVKPNRSNFKDFKRTLLEWVAIFLAREPDSKVNSYIAIPYNPYEPKPYERWTVKGMLDLDNELKVAEEFWDFLGGGSVYSELLDCFERVGIELKSEIDACFSKF